MIECPTCRAANDDQARFCAECGQKFVLTPGPAPSGLAASPPGTPLQPYRSPEAGNKQYMDDIKTTPFQPNVVDPNAVKRPKLHSPILEGDDLDERLQPLAKQTDRGIASGKGKIGGLRSPLLGAGDDDEEFDEQPSTGKRTARPGRSHLRSPLLGGADDEDDYEEDFPSRDKSAFPHRSQRPVGEPDDIQKTTNSGRPHLRSPLLEGDEDLDVSRPRAGFGKSPNQNVGDRIGGTPTSRSGKLHSPLFDGDTSGGYEDDDNPGYEEINDPHILRSPLLAAKVPVSPHDQPQTPPSPQPPSTVPAQNQNNQRVQNDWKNDQPVMPSPFVRENPISPEPSAWRNLGSSSPPAPADTGYGAAPGVPRRPAASPFPASPFSELPAAPQPTGFAQQAEPVPTWPSTNPAPTDNPFIMGQITGQSVEQIAPSVPESRLRTPGRPKVLNNVLSEGERTKRKFADDRDDDQRPIVAAEQSGPIMILLIPVFLATMAKAWAIYSLWPQIARSTALIADEISGLAVMVFLLIFAARGIKK